MSVYHYDAPVVGQAYAGREVLLRNLREGVLRGRSLALCGGPKSGKTGALLTVQGAVHGRWQRLPRETKVAALYADLGECRRETAAKIAERLWRALAQGAKEAAVLAGGAPPAIPQPSFARTKEPFLALAQACAEWAQRARGTAAWGRQVWLFDNADAVLDGKHDEVVAFLGAAARQTLEGGPNAVLLAGGRLLHDTISEKGHPLSVLRPQTMGVLSASEATRLVRAGLPALTEATVGELELASGRHPYALQLLLAGLEEQSDEENLAAVIAAAHDSLNELFLGIWSELDLGRGLTYRGAYAAPEHALMQLLVDSGQPTEIKTAEIQLGINSLREFAEMLEYAGVIERGLRGDVPTVRAHFRLWNEWYGERIRR